MFLRMFSDQGSAPKTPAFSGIAAVSTPSSRIVSPRYSA